MVAEQPPSSRAVVIASGQAVLSMRSPAFCITTARNDKQPCAAPHMSYQDGSFCIKLDLKHYSFLSFANQYASSGLLNNFVASGPSDAIQASKSSEHFPAPYTQL